MLPAAAPAPVGAQLGVSLGGSSCPAPHSPQHHAVPGPPPAPHPVPEVARTDSEPSNAATLMVPPPPVPKPQPGGRAPPECHPEHPACPHLTSAPPSREHPQHPTKPPHLRTTATPGCPATPGRAQRLHPHLLGLRYPRRGSQHGCHLLPRAVPCRAGGSAEQTQTAGGVRVEPRGGAGCCAHGPPVPQAAPPPSARNRGRERGGRAAHVGPLGSSSLSLHVARDNGSL